MEDNIVELKVERREWNETYGAKKGKRENRKSEKGMTTH